MPGAKRRDRARIGAERALAGGGDGSWRRRETEPRSSPPRTGERDHGGFRPEPHRRSAIGLRVLTAAGAAVHDAPHQAASHEEEGGGGGGLETGYQAALRWVHEPQ